MHVCAFLGSHTMHLLMDTSSVTRVTCDGGHIPMPCSCPCTSVMRTRPLHSMTYHMQSAYAMYVGDEISDSYLSHAYGRRPRTADSHYHVIKFHYYVCPCGHAQYYIRPSIYDSSHAVRSCDACRTLRILTAIRHTGDGHMPCFMSVMCTRTCLHDTCSPPTRCMKNMKRF